MIWNKNRLWRLPCQFLSITFSHFGCESIYAERLLDKVDTLVQHTMVYNYIISISGQVHYFYAGDLLCDF